MQQLPLGIRLRASSVFGSYCSGPNTAAVELLKTAQPTGRNPVIYLYGPAGVGKTHLLQAVCAHASEQGKAATYLPLREVGSYGPELLAGCERLDFVCLDDLSCVAGDAGWEQALFNLYRELEEGGSKLIVGDEQPPLALKFGLADLASRIIGGVALRLQGLDESQQAQALRLRAAQRGLELPEDAIAYLLRRLRRDMSTLCAFIDELDIASLVAQRRLTLRFVRDVLDAQPNKRVADNP